MADQKTITVLAVGDVWVNRDDPDSMFKHVSHVIKSADLALRNLSLAFILSKKLRPSINKLR